MGELRLRPLVTPAVIIKFCLEYIQVGCQLILE